MTLTETINRCIESKRNILSSSIIRGYRTIQKYAFPDIMSLKLSKITTQKLQQAVNRETETKSSKTLRNSYGLIKSIFKTYDPDAYLGSITLPQKYAMERGGWDNIQTMDKIYQYTFNDEKKIVENKINNFFDSSLNSIS